MARKDNHDVIKAFHRLTDAAEAYVNRSPRVKRIQSHRSDLLDAIANAQLILSVHQLPKEARSERSTKSHKDESRPLLEKELKETRATLHQLARRLRPVTHELEALQTGAQKAKDLLNRALVLHDQEHRDGDDLTNPFQTTVD
jgi:small-conductance mechanosensitive channel